MKRYRACCDMQLADGHVSITRCFNYYENLFLFIQKYREAGFAVTAFEYDDSKKSYLKLSIA